MKATWAAWMLLVIGVGAGVLVPSIATLAASDLVTLVVARYAEMISPVALLGVFAGVALIAFALPTVIAGDGR